MAATDHVFKGTTEVNEHFKSVGVALGLVRMRDLHLGTITDLELLVKAQETQEPQQ